MILVFDVGNTETTVGLWVGAELRGHWRLTTTPERTSDELAILIHQLLRIGMVQPTGSAIGSVVPAVTRPLAEACKASLGRPAIIVDASSQLPITLAVDEPLTVG